jgi:hypothetical protein
VGGWACLRDLAKPTGSGSPCTRTIGFAFWCVRPTRNAYPNAPKAPRSRWSGAFVQRSTRSTVRFDAMATSAVPHRRCRERSR